MTMYVKNKEYYYLNENSLIMSWHTEKTARLL